MPVVVVAASDLGETACATSTTSYVSVRPPILCVALTPASKTARMVARTGKFSVSVLTAGQADLAQRAGRPSAERDKLAAAGITPEYPPGEPGGPGPASTSPPGVGGAAAVLWCQVTGAVEVGDHQVIFGQVNAFRGAGGTEAEHENTGLLLRRQRRYLSTGAAVTPPAADGYPI
jgi:3-hydroxy-9,10-secoandrosta-1,3,5(10)-triene-9,17-dione monooxygenase reductase component